ncbi:hypothetical protein HCBG_07963 [Histoplasma capsulatum G186AR]|uniref:Uncharacterized protein n=2 Tax=Ajellomyces capsulatus TaxID=5037 RepID=C0NWX1_AJECG|nr:uncharacterized protein HCBG_07963 [Histoplasma capsulatum G186AR]EEH03837.1 hypothetical protein HCBG_07963 [Histoplasma capsulatum G186AR]KAG5295443.1 hypothetical protein I7I52_05718 [Histoplasma capsulatum]QSS73424.1 hypothetical protein I7I50_08201 [Histoplasma capsulatum G186AR]
MNIVGISSLNFIIFSVIAHENLQSLVIPNNAVPQMINDINLDIKTYKSGYIDNIEKLSLLNKEDTVVTAQSKQVDKTEISTPFSFNILSHRMNHCYPFGCLGNADCWRRPPCQRCVFANRSHCE